MTHLLGEEKVVDFVYLDFSKPFNTVSHSILWRTWQLVAWMGVLFSG